MASRAAASRAREQKTSLAPPPRSRHSAGGCHPCFARLCGLQHASRHDRGAGLLAHRPRGADQRQAVARLAARTATRRRARHHHRPRPGDDPGRLPDAGHFPAGLAARPAARHQPHFDLPADQPALAAARRQRRHHPAQLARGVARADPEWCRHARPVAPRRCQRLDRHRRRQRHHRLRQRFDARPIAVPYLWRSPEPTPPASRRCGSTRKAATSARNSSAR